jgi:hypothetical protein
MRLLYLTIAVLILSGCVASRTQFVPRTVPPLDSRLAEPCQPIPDPPAGGYDAWQAWVQDRVLVLYGECASRHLETVRAWPK